jgi:hypothetical protein
MNERSFSTSAANTRLVLARQRLASEADNLEAGSASNLGTVGSAPFIHRGNIRDDGCGISSVQNLCGDRLLRHPAQCMFKHRGEGAFNQGLLNVFLRLILLILQQPKYITAAVSSGHLRQVRAGFLVRIRDQSPPVKIKPALTHNA